MSKLEGKYTFWKLIEKVGIKIPIIQRDYAQGRDTKKVKTIRENFLNKIYEVLEQEKSIDLDFVYGTIKNSFLIPLDGQQRLTTLFLLHYYLALKDGELDDKAKRQLKNFTYETRLSSREFIELLIENKDKKVSYENIKKNIENQTWFFSQWKNDPTIKSMLTMLDAIEEKFKDTEDFFKKLINQRLITFSFLDLEDFKLTDELYVKMNARGKPLNEFENFKSKFENYLNDIKDKAKLDNEWLHIFWNVAKNITKDISDAPKLADEMFFNFFYNITLNFYIENDQVDVDKISDFKVYIFSNNQYKKIKENMDVEKLLKDNLYILKNNEEIYIHNTIDSFVKNISIFDIYNQVYNSKEYIKQLISILDTLEINEIFTDFILKKDISYWERARFYALSLGYINNLEETEFKRWQRVTFNLINNQLIQNTDHFINTLKSLKKLSLIYKNKQNIYEYIHQDKNKIEFFNALQREEESIKANLILQDVKWEEEFFEAEKNWYLDGQIGFLINYAKGNIEEFKKYKDKYIVLWDFAKDNKENQILVYQALLTKGDYLPKLGSNYTFCSFDGTSVRVKNDNWKKVFNSDKYDKNSKYYDIERTKLFKHLLDDIKVDDVESSLKFIITNWQDKNQSNCDVEIIYQHTLIKKHNIRYCKNLQIRWESYSQVYLLKKSQMNGYHSELYSWDLFITKFGLIEENKRMICWRLESNKPASPFEVIYYNETNSYDPSPFIVIENWNINNYNFTIAIWFTGKNYCIEFYDLNDKDIKQIDAKLHNILNANNFEIDKKNNLYKNFQYKLCKEDNLIDFLEKFSNQLNDYNKQFNKISS